MGGGPGENTGSAVIKPDDSKARKSMKENNQVKLVVGRVFWAN
jgi:hypothetical protein